VIDTNLQGETRRELVQELHALSERNRRYETPCQNVIFRLAPAERREARASRRIV